MQGFTGLLNIYFPCSVTTKGVSRLRKRWESCRKRQRDFVERNGLPSTDLLDMKDYRDETEEILNQFIFQNLPTCDCLCPPFATPGIKKAYHGLREDMLFSKNLSVIVSKFGFKCSTKKYQVGDSGKCLVVFNLNAENGIGTIIVSIPFNGLEADKIIFLKHIFYKRLAVSVSDSISGLTKETTFQQYISDLIHVELRLLEIEHVDYRARYSFLELENKNDLKYHAKELYGILVSDESYPFIKKERLKEVFGQNLFHHSTKGYYVSDTNALVLHHLRDCRDVYEDSFWGAYQNPYMCLQQYDSEKVSNDIKNHFKGECDVAKSIGFIETKDESYFYTDGRIDNDVAGIKNNLLPEFLRAIELHYLLDKNLSSEIVVQKRSSLQPWVFVPRAYSLWNVLYDKAVNKYHINIALMNAFGITQNVKDVKEEYYSLQQLIINFILIVLSVLTLVATISGILNSKI